VKDGWILGQTEGTWKLFGKLVFWGNRQRRGTHVSVPKIGSRDGVLCFGGIQRFYAELRRELGWGNFDLVISEVLPVGPRGFIEEGDHLCAFCVFEGMFCVAC
jgi:hypothetical protein